MSLYIEELQKWPVIEQLQYSSVNNLNQKPNNHPPVIVIKMIPANDNPKAIKMPFRASCASFSVHGAFGQSD